MHWGSKYTDDTFLGSLLLTWETMHKRSQWEPPNHPNNPAWIGICNRKP